MPILALIFGAVVGLSLGLTGGGGALFAVPLLVYGLSIEPRRAVGISLAAVGITSAIGFLGRWRAGQVEFAIGMVFALAGIFGAPIGTWLAAKIPGPMLLLLFAVLMFVVAFRMWRMASSPQPVVPNSSVQSIGQSGNTATLRKSPLNAAAAIPLVIVGILTGILSGMFGVGGGIISVPALVLFGGMPIHKAVGTSLLVVACVCAAGVVSHLWVGGEIPLDTTVLFVVGGVVGMVAGVAAGRYLSGPTLQRVFAVVIVAVAIFVVVRTLFHF